MLSDIEPVKLEKMDGLGKFVFFEVTQGSKKMYFVRGTDVRKHDHMGIRATFIKEVGTIEGLTVKHLGGGHYTYREVLNTVILSGSSVNLGKVPTSMHEKLCALIHEKYPDMNILDNHLE